MALIPNAERAVIDMRKLTGYVLNPQHPQGKHKARVFASVLGLSAEDAILLRDALLGAVQTKDATIVDEDDYGVRYQVDFEMTTNTGTSTVRSGWIIRTDEDYPRFATCYVM